VKVGKARETQPAPEAAVEGRPALALHDAEREQLEDLIAELLIAALERQGDG
jgi:hypothetical protein